MCILMLHSIAFHKFNDIWVVVNLSIVSANYTLRARVWCHGWELRKYTTYINKKAQVT